jgi:AcrR family transcriptional regulator
MKVVETETPGPAGYGSKEKIISAARDEFVEFGLAGARVDRIARRAKVNKAMIYYHFADKLALYRAVVGDMLTTLATTATDIAESDRPPAEKLNQFIDTFVRLADSRPWFPTMMLREISEGAPHLDLATLNSMKGVFLAFGRILAEGAAAGVFRPVHPILAYTSIIGPLLMNAARERMAAAPGRSQLPMFVDIPHTDLIAHIQYTATQMLQPR